MTTHAPLRSQRTQAQAVCHVRGLGDGDAPTSPVKIQGYWQDENALWSFMGDDLNRLHEPWVKDIVVERIAASDQVFNKEVMRRSALSQPERWANRRWVIGRVGEFLYQGLSFYGIWEMSEHEWGRRQRRDTRKHEFQKAKSFLRPQVWSLASQYLRTSIAATGPSAGIRHVV